MSFTQAVPTDIIPPNPKPESARVPTRDAKFGDLAEPILPSIVIGIAIRVMGRRP